MKSLINGLVLTGALTVATGGCSRYAQVQTDLLEQARRGVQMTSTSLQQRAGVLEQYHALRRKLIDDAFDDDARSRATQSADWVIEHRRAYAAGLDALVAARWASEQSSAADARTLEAVDQALQRLAWLHSIESKWINFPSSMQDRP